MKMLKERQSCCRGRFEYDDGGEGLVDSLSLFLLGFWLSLSLGFIYLVVAFCRNLSL